MALNRVLSGVILPKPGFRKSGSATIDFHPYTLSGDCTPGTSLSADDFCAIGPDQPFISRPCKVVSLQRIKFKDKYAAGFISPGDGDELKNFDINNHFDSTGKNSLFVSWETEGDAQIREISYMVIGEVQQ